MPFSTTAAQISKVFSDRDEPAAGAPAIALPGIWLAGALALSLFGFVWLMLWTDETISPLAVGTSTICAAGIVIVAVRTIFREAVAGWPRAARDFSEYLGLFGAICLLGAMASYPIAAINHGFADARLAAIDQQLRFNWIAWYDVVAAHPALQMLGRSVYDSIFVTPVILLGYFAATGRQADARRFILSFWLAAVLTLSLFSLMPAEGPLAFLWHGPVPYMPVSALYQAELIPALRDHALHSIDPGQLRGLVCAPSFHAASATLFIATAWRARSLRWPLITLNGAMLLATPVEGTHYCADLLAGILVSLVAIIGGYALTHLAGRRAVSALRVGRMSS
ncbi:phosphatase PAP2 family protein [Sphingomonas sp. BIUV-7]|uniref:Phosphatase PAP2 family protein n=1 Tax=Sphingomonas natans TaxID=3063330 RepID=A0ABT8Y618_9SPHN|nr:phosphatase PAP2 family protein [Sphingomonas sp. BIUV-7]MDO6413767.1 phosphatase PAP2 family protein [Sphingomonas sp. BIUV-7]